MPDRPHVVVVGGGVAGLAAAHALHREAGDSVRVTVLEQSGEVGGKLTVADLGGVRIDVGAESMLMRRPEGVRLADRVGLGPDLVHPASTGSLLWSRGRLRRLPGGTLMGVPLDLRDLATSGVLSVGGLARIPIDLLLPRRSSAGDRALGPYVEQRLGREVVDRLVEPLLGGVYAGHADQLSLDAVLPQLSAAVRVERSLLRSAERSAGPVARGAPVFAGIQGGMGRLPAALAATCGADIRTRQTVQALQRTPHGWRVLCGPARRPTGWDADAVVLAVPAVAAARLLTDVAPGAAERLREIPYASVAIVSLLVRRRTVPELPPGSGFLVPPVEGRTVKAVTFSSQKWGWTGALRPDLHVLRASVGRHGEEAILQRDDVDLVADVMADMRGALGWPTRVRPVASLVTRWGGALPQYLVGHLDQVARIRASLDGVLGLAVCGAAYDGVGIPACVASGESAAAQVLRGLRTRPQWGHGYDAAAGATGGDGA